MSLWSIHNTIQSWMLGGDESAKANPSTPGRAASLPS